MRIKEFLENLVKVQPELFKQNQPSIDPYDGYIIPNTLSEELQLQLCALEEFSRLKKIRFVSSPSFILNSLGEIEEPNTGPIFSLDRINENEVELKSHYPIDHIKTLMYKLDDSTKHFIGDTLFLYSFSFSPIMFTEATAKIGSLEGVNSYPPIISPKDFFPKRTITITYPVEWLQDEVAKNGDKEVEKILSQVRNLLTSNEITVPTTRHILMRAVIL